MEVEFSRIISASSRTVGYNGTDYRYCLEVGFVTLMKNTVFSPPHKCSSVQVLTLQQREL